MKIQIIKTQTAIAPLFLAILLCTSGCTLLSSSTGITPKVKLDIAPEAVADEDSGEARGVGLTIRQSTNVKAHLGPHRGSPGLTVALQDEPDRFVEGALVAALNEKGHRVFASEGVGPGLKILVQLDRFEVDFGDDGRGGIKQRDLLIHADLALLDGEHELYARKFRIQVARNRGRSGDVLKMVSPLIGALTTDHELTETYRSLVVEGLAQLKREFLEDEDFFQAVDSAGAKP